MFEYKEKRKDKVVFNISFANLRDLYNYLKRDPYVNSRVFRTMYSKSNDYNFHGDSLDKSIEYLLGGYDRNGLTNFLETNNELRKLGKDDSDSRKLVRSLYGGVPLSPLVAAGVPDCMLKYDRDASEKHITIYYGLGYPAYTSTDQIVNRGLATLYIIQSLEEKGYIVDFKAFELSSVDEEVFNFTINLKQPGDLFLNVEKCYYPFKGKEFLRRVLFRVLESQSVTHYDWGEGYGRPADIGFISDFYNTNNTDLIISYPDDMNIEGDNLYEDVESLIVKLDIQDEFDMKKIKQMKINGR